MEESYGSDGELADDTDFDSFEIDLRAEGLKVEVDEDDSVGTEMVQTEVSVPEFN